MIPDYEYVPTLPISEAPWSRATPVKLCTLCSRDSLVLAGLDGALVVRELCLVRFRERSPLLGGPGGPLVVGGGAVVARGCC